MTSDSSSSTHSDSPPTTLHLSSPFADTTKDSAHLAFAPIALAQYHNVAEKLASNNLYRIRRALSQPDLKTETSEGIAEGSINDTESMGESERPESSGGIHARPYLTRLRLALAPYTVHFHNPGYVRDDTLRMLERDVVKKTLEESRKSLELREELGLSWEFWDDLAGVLKAAIPSLERRCFAAPDPAAPEYEGLSGPLIASYSPSLLRDLERLNQRVYSPECAGTWREGAEPERRQAVRQGHFCADQCLCTSHRTWLRRRGWDPGRR